jgi:hypothetical protein
MACLTWPAISSLPGLVYWATFMEGNAGIDGSFDSVYFAPDGGLSTQVVGLGPVDYQVGW